MIVSLSALWFPKREVIGQKAFWRKVWKKGREKAIRAQLLPCWAEHLQASAVPAQNYKISCYKPALLTPQAGGWLSPTWKMGISIFPLPSAIKVISLFPCIYRLPPSQCYGCTNFKERGKKETRAQRNLYLQGAQIPSLEFLKTTSWPSTTLLVIGKKCKAKTAICFIPLPTLQHSLKTILKDKPQHPKGL